MKSLLLLLLLPLCVRSAHGANADDTARIFLQNVVSNNPVTLTNTLSVSNLTTLAPGSAIVGVTNGAAAISGLIGEYIRTTNTGMAVGPSAQYYDITNFVITPGDWEFGGATDWSANGATFSVTDFRLGFSVTPGNSTVGLVNGINTGRRASDAPVTFITAPQSAPTWRFNTPTNATVYYKGFVGNYTVATPLGFHGAWARRVR